MLKFLTYKDQTSTLKTESLAGLTTFLTMMYIIVVNPMLLAQAGIPYAAVLTATVLVSAISSILMGVFAKNPIALAPGMGLNSFFTYTIVLQMHVSWQVALGAVFWSGILFVLMSVFNVRKKIVEAIPQQLRYAMACGIGLFISFIGFKNAGIIVSNPDTLVSFGHITSVSAIFLIGFIITAILICRKTPGALILGIIITTLLATIIGRFLDPTQQTIVNWHGFFAWPSFAAFFQLDLLRSLHYSLWPVLFTLAFTNLFDSLSTFMGVAHAGNLLDESGEPRNLKASLTIDAFSSVLAGLFGSSSATSYIESATGIEEGGRTGLTAVVVGLLFLPFLFLSPLAEAVPAIATAPALILVGVFMMRPILHIHWVALDDAIPAFITIILIPLTYSITQGIIWGILTWLFIKIALKKYAEVNFTFIILALFSALLIYIMFA